MSAAAISTRRLGHTLGSVSRRPLTCLFCQWRRDFTTSPLRPAKLAEGASLDPKSTVKGAPIEAPRSYGKRIDGEFTPKPLPRPIGMPEPPRAGQNTGIDTRSIRQRRDDFVDYEKHMARRKELTAAMSKPYFRDWGNLKFHEGKSFIAPPRLFKADMSLYFPNFYGETLLKTSKEPRDTTPTLLGKASVVSIFSSQWAEGQAQTFVSKKANSALHEVLAKNSDVAQLVSINYEDNKAKAWLIRMFMGSLRRKIPERDWDKYFLVKRGITDSIRESIGLLNSKVGYTFLVDQQCRIRWAGSGAGHPDELDSLAKGLAKMAEDARAEARSPKKTRAAKAKEPAL